MRAGSRTLPAPASVCWRVPACKTSGLLRWKKGEKLGSSNFNLVIGCNRSNLKEDDLGSSFRGLIDEPMMWNRALSTNEVAFLYQSQQ